uniref:Uncharacterized protein n=1 Tax=Anguilla anguilla TaxID=7936 RepID=A0A0E9V0Q4_ANGAN
MNGPLHRQECFAFTGCVIGNIDLAVFKICTSCLWVSEV